MEAKELIFAKLYSQEIAVPVIPYQVFPVLSQSLTLIEYEVMGKAAHAGGPLDAKCRELIKLGMAIGARLEGAAHSHVRKALAAGVTPEEIRPAAVLAISTLGLPTTVMALTWADDVLNGKRRRKD